VEYVISRFIIYQLEAETESENFMGGDQPKKKFQLFRIFLLKKIIFVIF
jgi:hypothetical protein